MTDVARISSGLSTLLNPFGPSWATSTEKAKEARPVGEQVQHALFGRKKPQELDTSEFEDLLGVFKILDAYRRKFVSLTGDSENEYRIKLSEGSLAMIDAEGTILLGVGFLRPHKEKIEMLLGVLAHEIGHRPKQWAQYKANQNLTRNELEELCRYEETRADLFAGRALAEVGKSPEPMIDFLMYAEEGPHPHYYPAKLRAEVIREGFREQKSLAANRKKLWPELDRVSSLRLHVGDF